MDLENINNVAGDGSFGLAPILNMFSTHANNKNRPKWDLYVVNMLTLIRNNQQKGKQLSVLINNTIRDAELLITHIENYVELDKLSLSQPTLIIYIPFYQIPQLYVKKISPSLVEQQLACDKIRNQLKPRVYTQGSLTIHVVYVGSNRSTPKCELINYINAQISNSYKFKRTAIISHIAMDLHLFQDIVEIILIECFTGKLKKSNVFNEKVFNTKELPFHPYIHLLLGDNTFIKRTLKKKQYDELLAFAKSHSWKYRPTVLIEKDLLSMKLVEDKHFFEYKL